LLIESSPYVSRQELTAGSMLTRRRFPGKSLTAELMGTRRVGDLGSPVDVGSTAEVDAH